MLLRYLKAKLHRLFYLETEPIVKKSPEGSILIGTTDKLILGQQVTFGGDVILYANETISIGDHTMVGMNTILHTTTHDYKEHPMWRYRIDRPIRIGQHVWIGTSCVVLAGVIIEDYTVVAAGSVVAANVPKGAIVAGTPARIIGYRDPSFYNGAMSIKDLSEALPKSEGHLNKWCKDR
ncbi:MAG: transferase hexapeptide repeat containing protein [Chitinophagaceae bacterium]|nr:transferase hexapeptide repeat containing protein [Chitinophagaceae bacterium]